MFLMFEPQPHGPPRFPGPPWADPQGRLRAKWGSVYTVISVPMLSPETTLSRLPGTSMLNT